MDSKTKKEAGKKRWQRRDFLKLGLATGGLALSGGLIYRRWRTHVLPELSARAATFIAKVPSYDDNITDVLLDGFNEVGIKPAHIRGKRIFLKPNLVETHAGHVHINTHPHVIRGAIEAFRKLGAASVLVAEGAGHCRDALLLLEESGLADVLYDCRVRFKDLNYSECFTLPNAGGFSSLPLLVFPDELRRADVIVSMAKMKTHHWAGTTLSLKNFFGVMPGSLYGWPKNVLHHAGIEQCIVDINATLKPHFAIVDGIIGMQGDGPIMGGPKHAGVIVMGNDLAAVDATCSRIMGIKPEKIPYLALASSALGPIAEHVILQRGETIRSVRTTFSLPEHIPVFKQLRES